MTDEEIKTEPVTYDDSEIKKSLSELSAKCDTLKAKCDDLERKQLEQAISKEDTIEENHVDLFDEYCRKKYSFKGGNKIE